MAKKTKNKQIDINALLNKEQITDVDLTNELASAMLNYAIEVIKDRAISHVNDGLKPVQRHL